MSTHVQGALIIAAAVLIAACGAAYMLSSERDVERCVEANRPIPEPPRLIQLTEEGMEEIPPFQRGDSPNDRI